MTKEELEEKIIELNKEVYELCKMCLMLGNKDYKNNFMIKDRMSLIEKYKKDLEVLENGNN